MNKTETDKLKHSDEIAKVESFIDSVKMSGRTTVNIVVHDAPDPDAMGSAVGFQLLLKTEGIDSVIYYRGEVSHPQNKTMINVLNIYMEKVSEDVKNGNQTVCVDCTESNSCADAPDLVIDHHKNSSNSKLKIILSKYGACSTIVFNLLTNMCKLEEFSESADVFTALLLGVRTDTNDLISENMIKEDFVAYQELLELSDKEKLQKVMNYPLPRYSYDRRLLLHREGNSAESNGVFIGGVGYIPEVQRDVISVLAEEYARMDSINTAIIFAIVDKKKLQVSVRSSNVSLDVGTMCKEMFSGFGGGTSYKGGASIPLNFYSNLENGERDTFWEVTCKHMFRNVLKETFSEEKND
jgi:nanoRNase/pAp phosphatase (c-di-AMP/oligoRNAs hydrolase)